MSKKAVGVLGLGLVSLGSTILATPAQAAINCGTAPTGGTLTTVGDSCQLIFDTPGDYSVTVPTSANQLYAILVGSGTGAIVYEGSTGYAGNGGQVKYTNLTGEIGNQLNVHVGGGGATTTNWGEERGTDTTLAYSGAGSSAWTGNLVSSGTAICNIYDGYPYIVMVGQNGKGLTRVVSGSDPCLDHEGLGINPANGDLDSDGNSVPDIFNNYNNFLGAGGQVIKDGTPSDSGYGRGAGIGVNSGDNTFMNVADYGNNGAVIFRWRHVAPLANTGFDTVGASGLAFGLMAVGAGLTIASRRQQRSAK